ncbi:MAG: hypothetical protein LAO05_12425 [Acidobacteriia bacterium]|nr:hypothetical protein [Terriglobia bacterium]
MIGAAPPGENIASVALTSSGGVITSAKVWPHAAPGSYDVLLISQGCGSAGGTVVAAFDEGPAAGFTVSAGGDPIPALSRGALAMFVLLVTALGIWVLATRRG